MTPALAALLANVLGVVVGFVVGCYVCHSNAAAREAAAEAKLKTAEEWWKNNTVAPADIAPTTPARRPWELYLGAVWESEPDRDPPV